MSDSLWSLGLQHARLPCPLPSPRVCSNSCPLSHWCPPTISFSVTPFSSCPQSFPETGSFPVSQLFSSGGQSIGASASILPVNIQSQEDPLLREWLQYSCLANSMDRGTWWVLKSPGGHREWDPTEWLTHTLALWDPHFILPVLIVVICVRTGSESLAFTFPAKLKTWILSTSHKVRGQVSASEPYWVSPT